MKENIANLGQLQSQVLDEELIKWKREQQLSGNGVPMQSNLNTIQEWCELLADLIWTSRQQVNNVARINSKTVVELRQPHLAEMLDDLSKQVTSLLSTLVTSTFVIEKQPPQVMKTNTRFTATVRLLVGGQLNVYMTPPRVSVVIISEQQAQLLLKSEGGRSKQPIECGDILNNTGSMEYQPTSRQLSVSFRNMQLRKIKRAEKKGTESVMDEKLTLLFQSEFNVGGGELVFQVWTLSLPVVVIVHGNQEPHGWATVTWDNAFSPQGRVPFQVPDKVTWGLLAETLRIKFLSQTGGDLTEDNVRFLAEKIFSRTSLPLNPLELNAMTVSWTQFCKDALPDRNFTFWEWFYMVVKVTRDFLRQLWCDRLIMGFIQKKQAEEMLAKCSPGTFILRFSDSELGGITIAWTGEGNEVFSLQPFTSRDLTLRSLADRVLDLQQLQFLYPNISKDDVFGKYYTKPEGNEVFSLQPFTSRDLTLRSLADRVLDLQQLQFLYPNISKDDVFGKYYTKPEGNEVFSLQPFTSRDLTLRSLADRVLDLQQLQFLYPNISKDDVFGKYYTKPDDVFGKYYTKPENEVLKNGYVRPGLVTTLPSYISPSPAYSAHSPDSHRNTPSVHTSYLGGTPAPMDAPFDTEMLLDQIRNFDEDSFDFDLYNSGGLNLK
ncbi:STAT protein, DNA binding domain-containing protein [Phthorimaea operculella]|nr:STAT protein, DNA binding domain-containing protein [Phthorimaea operculella]